MTDLANIAEVGFAVNTSGLQQGATALDTFNQKQKEVAQGATELTRVQQEHLATERNYADVARRTGQTLEEVRARYTAASFEAGLHAVAVRSAATAHVELNTAAGASSGIFSGFISTLFGYGGAHKAATAEVLAHGRAHGSASEGVKLFRESVHALHPELAAAGIGMGELTGFTSAARGGMVALAVALGGTLVVEIIKTGMETEKLKKEFNDTFGSAGPEMFNKTREAAEGLHTSIANLTPAIEQAYGSLRRAQIQQQDEVKKALQERGVSFAPGEAGQSAMNRVAGMNPQLDPAMFSRIQELVKVFQDAGLGAVQAQQKASAFFASIPKDAEQARTAAVQATADLNKLFQVGGMGADDATKATQKFFEEIKKGGLTSTVYDELTSKSREAAKAIAEAFGFTGPDAVDKFAVELDKVGKLSFPAILAALSDMKPKIDEMVVPASVADSWSKLKEEFKHVFEVLAEGAGEGGGGGAAVTALNGITKALKDSEPGFASFEKAAIGTFKNTAHEIDLLLQGAAKLKEWYDWAAGLTGAAASQMGLSSGLSDQALLQKLGISQAASATFHPELSGAEGASEGAKASEQTPWQTGTGVLSPTGQEAQQATSDFNQLDKGLEDTAQSADATVTATGKFNNSLDAAAAASETAGTNVTSFSGILSQSAEGWGQAASAAGSAFGGIENAISGFIAYLQDAASQVPTGGGGIQADVGGSVQDSADVGPNATGGIYTVGGPGNVTSKKGSTPPSSDSITLRGSVSPGEVVAIIPADKANHATMAQLQDIINESPISIGGGNISGGGSGINSSLLDALLHGVGTGTLPPALSDPQVRALLAQIAALAAAGKAGTATTAGDTTGLPNALGSASLPSIKINEPKQQPQQREQPQHGGGGGGGGGGPSMPWQSRNSGLTKEDIAALGGGRMYHDPSFDQPSSPNTPSWYPPQYGTDQVNNPYYSPFGQGDSVTFGPEPADYFWPPQGYDQSAQDDTGTGWDPGYFDTQPDYSPFESDPYYGGGDGSSPVQDNDYADIGENATGGIYTIGGPGSVKKGYSGRSGTDSVGLRGSVSPGEVVAVIPAESATKSNLDQIKNLIHNSSISASGGLPQGLALTDAQVQAALAQVAALLANAAGTKKIAAPTNALGSTAGGGGISIKEPKEQPQQKEDQPRSGGGGGGGGGGGRAQTNPGLSASDIAALGGGRMWHDPTFDQNISPNQFDTGFQANTSYYNPLQPSGTFYDPFSGSGSMGNSTDAYSPWWDSPATQYPYETSDWNPDYFDTQPDYSPFENDPYYGGGPDDMGSPVQDNGADTSSPAQDDSGGDYGGGDWDYATGGVIMGPGTATSDSIPINASAGEFMVKADGSNLRDAIRYFGGKKGYADGGPVNPYPGVMGPNPEWGDPRLNDPTWIAKVSGGQVNDTFPVAMPSANTVAGGNDWTGSSSFPVTPISPVGSGGGNMGGAGISSSGGSQAPVNINVFGVTNPQQFMASRLAITRSISQRV